MASLFAILTDHCISFCHFNWSLFIINFVFSADHCLSFCHFNWPLFIILSFHLTTLYHFVISYDHCLPFCHLDWPMFIIFVISTDHCLSLCHFDWPLSFCHLYLSFCHLNWPLFIILSFYLTTVYHFVISTDLCLTFCHFDWPLLITLSFQLTIACHFVTLTDHRLSFCYFTWHMCVYLIHYIPLPLFPHHQRLGQNERSLAGNFLYNDLQACGSFLLLLRFRPEKRCCFRVTSLRLRTLHSVSVHRNSIQSVRWQCSYCCRYRYLHKKRTL